MCWRFYIILLLLLCACHTAKQVEHTDTVRVHGGHTQGTSATQWIGARHTLTEWLHDTVTVVVERYDSTGRVTDKTTLNKGSMRRKTIRDTIWLHDTIVHWRHDTILVAAHEQVTQKTDTVAVAEPTPAWQRGLYAGSLLAIIGAAICLAKRKAKQRTDR